MPPDPAQRRQAAFDLGQAFPAPVARNKYNACQYYPDRGHHPVAMRHARKQLHERADRGRARDGNHPGGEDMPYHPPVYRGGFRNGSGPEDRTADGVRGRHRKTEVRGQAQRSRRGRFGRETLGRFQFGNPLAQRMDDAPTPQIRACRHRRGRGHDDPERHVERFARMGRYQCQRDDSHGLLGVIRAVGERHETAGHELEAAEYPVYGFLGTLPYRAQ